MNAMTGCLTEVAIWYQVRGSGAETTCTGNIEHCIAA